MNTIYNQENAIFKEIIKTLDSDECEGFVSDGLCWADIKCGEDLPQSVYEEMENLYIVQDKRVIFLLKEPNGNAGADYRDWHWKENSTYFCQSIAFWLEGILKTTERYYPIKDELRVEREIFTESPFAFVNVKKTAGGANSKWTVIYDYAEKYSAQIRKQLDLYNPNIIVCCGSSNNPSKPRMLEIAMKYFYQDYSFEKINNFCYYCRDKHLLLIDSFHPTSPINKIDKFNEMFKSYNAFLKLQDK